MAVRLEIWRSRPCLGVVDGDAAFISIIPDDLVNAQPPTNIELSRDCIRV